MIQGYKLTKDSQTGAPFGGEYVESLPDTASRATTTESGNPTSKSKTAVYRAMVSSSPPQRPSRFSKGAPSSQSSISSTTAPAASARPLFSNLGKPRSAITSGQSGSKCLALMTAYLPIGSRSGSLRIKRDIIYFRMPKPLTRQQAHRAKAIDTIYIFMQDQGSRQEKPPLISQSGSIPMKI